MSNKPVVVKVENLTKSFKIPLEASSGLKQKLINTLKGRKGYRVFSPLNDISFDIEEGDFFGIVGRNGSGKSTLLKTLAGIYTPQKGAVHVAGTLVPFIELGVGFNPELTGRENVFLNGALLGFSHDEMEAMYDDIVDFAELGEFMDERLKNYSSGMQVRLAFSIAIKAQGDILLLDEVLAVGDEAFQQKCFEYFRNLKDSRKTVILVTHDMSAVKRYCNKALLLDKSRVVYVGDPFEAANKYTMMMFGNSVEGSGYQPIKIISAADRAKPDHTYVPGEPIVLDIELDVSTKQPFRCAYSISRDSVIVAEANSGNEGILKSGGGEKHTIRLKIDTSNFIQGNYSLNMSFDDTKTMKLIAYEFRVFNFVVKESSERYGGYFKVESEWRVEDEKNRR